MARQWRVDALEVARQWRVDAGRRGCTLSRQCRDISVTVSRQCRVSVSRQCRVLVSRQCRGCVSRVSRQCRVGLDSVATPPRHLRDTVAYVSRHCRGQKSRHRRDIGAAQGENEGQGGSWGLGVKKSQKFFFRFLTWKRFGRCS